MMNKQLFEAAGVTEEQYRNWCKETDRPIHSNDSKREFFARIQDGRLVLDKSGHLVKKYKRRK